MKSRYLFWVLLFLSGSLCMGQQRGTPLLQNYDRKAYDGGPRNWSVAVGEDGLVYVGNTNGLRVYDGENWQNYLPDYIFTELLPVSPTRIYAAAYDDFGYLTKTETGYTFTSLAQQLPDSIRNSVFVANVTRAEGWVYFGGEAALYLFEESTQTLSVKSQLYSQVIQQPDGTCLLLDEDTMRLARLEADRIIFIDQSEPALQKIDQNLKGIAPGKGADLLLFWDQMCYRFDTKNKTYSPFPTQVDALLQNDAIYETEYVRDQNGRYFYILGTHQNGLLVLDAEGKLIGQINQANGLIHNDISNMDFHTGFLWVTTNKGISKIALGYPFSFFGQPQGLESAVYAARRSRNGVLYAATNSGLHYQQGGVFQPVAEMPVTQCWQIEDFEDGGVLVAGGNAGFFHVRNGKKVQRIVQDWSTMAIERSRQDSAVVFQACYQGFYILRYENGAFRELGAIPAMDTVVSYSVIEDKDGILWVGGMG